MKNQNFKKIPLISPDNYRSVECQLAQKDDIFQLIFSHTAGDVCTTGCAYFNKGKCEAYKKLLSEQHVQ